MTLVEFPSFRRARGVLPFIIGVLALVLIVLFPFLPPAMLHAFAAALFAALLFQSLLGAGYSSFHAAAITALTFAQAGILLSAAGRAGSIWLALAGFCVAMVAADFVRHRDARRVMALGGAVSLAQLLDPLGGLLAIFLLPLCVGLPRSGETRAKAGLLALLLFMPVVTALVLAYFRVVLGVEPTLHRAPPDTQISLTVLLCAAFVCVPVLWLTIMVPRLNRPPGLFTVYTALAVLLATTLGVLTGASADLTSLLAAGAAISAAALCTWKPSPQNQSLALAATALGAVLSWLLFNLSVLVL